jgi:hypothetical protein
MQDFEILANRNLRGFEMAAKFGDQDTALAVEQIENGAAAFFVEHWSQLAGGSRSGMWPPRGLLWRISFYSVSFHLSTAKSGGGGNAGMGCEEWLSHLEMQKAAIGDPVTPVFVDSWEPNGVITNAIPAPKTHCFVGAVLS